MTPDAVEALAAALEAAIGHWEDAGAVSRFDSMDGARAIADALAAAGYRIVREEPAGEGLREAEYVVVRHAADDLMRALPNPCPLCGFEDFAHGDECPTAAFQEAVWTPRLRWINRDNPAGLARLPAPLPALDVERLARAYLRKCGYFPWGGDAWIHKDDEGTVLSRDDAIAAAYERDGQG